MSAQSSDLDRFEFYFLKADLDRDGRISGNEAVAFLQNSNLPRHILVQIWMYADQNKVGSLGRPEFYNALKLVTVAQSKRDLTPDIVKAALYGPASMKIPAPRINVAPTPVPHSNDSGPSPGTQGLGVNSLQGMMNPDSHGTRPPLSQPPHTGFVSSPAISSQGVPGASFLPVSQRPYLPASTGISVGSHGGVSSQVPDRSLAPSANNEGFNVPEVTGLLQSASTKSVSQGAKEASKELLTKENGPGSNSVLGDAFSTVLSENQQNITAPASVPPLTNGGLTPRSELTVGSKSVSGLPASDVRQFRLSEKENQQTVARDPSSIPVSAGQSHSTWPRLSQSDVQRYSKVFLQVDRDQHGKITGEQARTLFLSWRLPREVLKQVWDLSDQDNDSMLSLREFCIALYLMERYREGRPLPAQLPDPIIFDSTQPAVGNAALRPHPVVGGKPPHPAPSPQPNEPIQQKPKVPVLEKHLVNQLSTEEQDSLNKKFDEAKDAENKVADLEKEILEAKQRTQLYHAKMQELVLYKSRCDNRLNEISERVVADKREADSLAKKYEDKYKAVGDVASKLTTGEATFHDIQEEKMDLYRAIVKLEQGNPDGFKDRAIRIHSDLEAVVKTLNERCKIYGLRGKPASLLELPFGWEPGIGAVAADWDGDWDKLEDEGFSYVKELTSEVENVVAPPKPKSALKRQENVTSSSDHTKTTLPKLPEISTAENDDGQQNSTPERSPSTSLARYDSVRREFRDLLRREKEIYSSRSPQTAAFDTRSEYGTESALSGDARFDEPHLGSSDAYYDTDSAWDFNPISPKGNQSYGDDSGLNPIRTGPFFDSVPSTPLYGSAGPFGFADSVPSTPMLYNNSPFDDSFSRFDSFNMSSDSGEPPFGSLARWDSMRSTKDSDFDRGMDYSSTSLARFDSFRSTADSDQGLSSSSLSRFDSMKSNREYSSEYGYGGFPSFDDANIFKAHEAGETPRRAY